MGSHRSNDILKGDVAQTVGASQTNSVISDEFAAHPDMMTHGVRIDAKTSAATVAAGVTMKLQHGFYDKNNVATWEDTGTVAITGSPGLFSIILHPSHLTDAQYFPLRPHLRVVLSTGAGDSVTVSDLQCVGDDLIRPSAGNVRSV